MPGPYRLSAETIALFERAERAVQEGHRLADQIQREQNLSLDQLRRMVQIAAHFSSRSNLRLQSELVDIRVPHSTRDAEKSSVSR